MQTINLLEQSVDQLYGELRQSTLKHWLEDQKFSQHLDEKVRQWACQAKSSLDQAHPYLKYVKELERWNQVEAVSVNDFNEILKQYIEFYQTSGKTGLADIWKFQLGNNLELLSHNNAELQLQFRLIKEKWQRQLTEAVAHWEFEQLALQRDAFLEEIKDFLATLQKMAKHKESLGIDTGIFIDYSAGKLRPQDVNQFEEWLNYLENDPELLKLCEMIGNAQPSHYSRKPLANRNQDDQQDEIINLHARDEIIGVRLAQDLNLALPSELALLSDPELETLFDLKYLESNLMSFNIQGIHTGRVLEDPRQKQRKVGQKGPMIICLDTSGSMHGQPELIAKAITLYLSMQALKAKRVMYLINFSTNLTALKLQKKHSLDELIYFLSQSFHGGTDILPAISHAVEMLEDNQFRNADIVVISDFIMGRLPEELMNEIEHYKQQGNGFYAVAIGNLKFEHLNSGLFDHQWIYQSQTGTVTEVF